MSVLAQNMQFQTEYVHVDSRSRNLDVFPINNHYEIELPKTYKGVKKVDLLSMQIPNSNFNVDEGNNTFWLYESAAGGPDSTHALSILTRRTQFNESQLYRCTVPTGMHTITTFLDAVRLSIANAVCADGTERKPQWVHSAEHDTTLNRVYLTSTDGVTKRPDVWCAVILGSLQPVWRLRLQNRCSSTCEEGSTVSPNRQFSMRLGTAQTVMLETSLCPLKMTPENGTDLAQQMQMVVRNASKECRNVEIEFVAAESNSEQATFNIYTPPRNAVIGMPAPQLFGTGDVQSIKFGEWTTEMVFPGYQLAGTCALARPLGSESTVTVVNGTTFFTGIPDLTTERYIMMRCPELGEIVQVSDANLKNVTDSYTRRTFSDIFAVVPLPSVAGSLVFQDGASGKGDDALGSRFFKGGGLSHLNKLTFEFVSYNGTRVNFRGLEHSFMLRITYHRAS